MTDFETWLRSKKNLRPSTAALYVKCLNRVRRMFDRDPKIPDIGTVRDSTVNLSETSRRNILQALEHWFDFVGTPIVIEDKPQARRRAPEYLSEEQMRRLFSTSLNLEERGLLSVLYYGGLRLDEGVSLTWPDIDLQDARIRIRNGKGGVTDEVFVQNPCVDSLADLRAFGDLFGCDHEYVFHTLRLVDGRYVPVGKPCTPLSKRRAYEAVVALGERAGIPLHPHMLRHSIATHMVDRGAPLPFVQRHMRHADPSSTLIYYHMNSEAQRNAIRNFVPDLSEERRT